MTPVLIVPTMLFAGFFVNQDNIPVFLWPLKMVAVFRYGFQAYMLNEFQGNTMDCEIEVDPVKSCDPLGDFASPDTLEASLWAMGIIWIVFYFLAFIIMKKLT